MKVQNVKSSFTFPVLTILGREHDMRVAIRSKATDEGAITADMSEADTDKVLADRTKALNDLILKYAALKEDSPTYADDKASLTDQIRAYFTPGFLAALDKFGAKVPMDNVTLMVTPGSILFEIYSRGLEMPTAPLAQAFHQAKLQKHAVALSQEEIEPAKEVLDVVQQYLEDDAKWATVEFTANFKVGEKDDSVSLSNAALPYFKEAREALLALYTVDAESAKAQ